jgi:hypothetical protein
VLRRLRARLAPAGADPDGGRFDRTARQRPRSGRRRLHGQAVCPVRTGSAGARADAARRRRRRHHRQARPAQLRSGGPQRLHQRADAGPVGARTGPAGNPAGAQRPPGLQEQLVDHLCEWGEEVSNNAIEVYVHRLRKKIEWAASASPPCAASATASRNSRNQPSDKRLRRAAGRRAGLPPPAAEADEGIQHSLFGEILDWMLAPCCCCGP